MNTTLTLQLLSTELTLPDLTIGQAIDIAHTPQEYNEKRLSALIGHVSGDLTLAGRLTVQERYYLLLNHQAISHHEHASGGSDDYFIETVPSDIPDTITIGDMNVQHLRGAHACVLEGLCENVFEWLCGQMACQLYGDLTTAVGGSDSDLIWPQVEIGIKDIELSRIIQERVEAIKALPTNAFNDLVEQYNKGVYLLEHFVEIGCDNSGITLIKQGGAGDIPARFLTLESLQGSAARLAECVVERRYGHDGTRQNEFTGGA